jgi:hypothetical protein
LQPYYIETIIAKKIKAKGDLELVCSWREFWWSFSVRVEVGWKPCQQIADWTWIFVDSPNSPRGSWAEGMSVYSKLDMNLGGWCDRKGRTWWKAPQTPLINLRYRKGCGFSPNSNKAYSNVICFFFCKKEILIFWFVLIFNSEMNFFS